MSKKKKKFTVPEFKTWLEGIMQFQDSDWSPNREQWDEIYQKIMDLKEPVNREKMGLNDPALDEIAEIVRYNVDEGLKHFAPRMAHSHNPAPHNPAPHNSAGGEPDPWRNIGNNGPAPAPSGIENKSLSELREEAERNHNSVGGQGGGHRLPDRVDDASVPEDFV